MTKAANVRRGVSIKIPEVLQADAKPCDAKPCATLHRQVSESLLVRKEWSPTDLQSGQNRGKPTHQPANPFPETG